MYKRYLKRILDLVLALIAFILLFPAFLIITIILLFINNGKPFFYQDRPGLNEKIFKIIKFKTMTDKTNSEGVLLPNSERVTKFGTFLRNSSLDEIPQLINIIKGDMSIVGPRPLRVHYLPYYTKEERIRHSVRPGVTGLAQVSGRNLLSWDKKLEKDIAYVKNISFWLDLTIILKTIKKVLNPENIELDENMLDLDQERASKINT